MNASPDSLLEAIAKLSPVVVALLLVGGIIYIQMQERRFEAERADRDRELAVTMIRESIDQAGKDRKLMHERGNRFLENQQTFISQQERLVAAIELHGEMLRMIKRDQIKATSAMRKALRTETDVLIQALEKIGQPEAE